MTCQVDSGIHAALSRYLNGACTLQEFEDWFMPLLWDLADGDDSEPRKLAGAIAGLIAEYSNGGLSESSLREELADIAAPALRPEGVPSGEELGNNGNSVWRGTIEDITLMFGATRKPLAVATHPTAVSLSIESAPVAIRA